jgi:hypothetical protein
MRELPFIECECRQEKLANDPTATPEEMVGSRVNALNVHETSKRSRNRL